MAVLFSKKNRHFFQGFNYGDGKKYDGTKESIEDKFHKPNSRHPNAHTNQEIRWIRNCVKRNPRIKLCELWAKLEREKGYTNCNSFKSVMY